MNIFKKVLFQIARLSGLPLIFRFLYQKNRISVLLYHDVEPVVFERHLQYILKYYNIITIEQLRDFLFKKNVVLPRYACLLTFDDGHVRNHNLIKLLEEYRVRPAIFLVTEVTDTVKPFWFKLPFSDSAEKERLKNMDNDERLNYLENQFPKDFNSSNRQALTWDEAAEMMLTADFHSHTRNHPCLPRCDEDTAFSELSGSKTDIEKKLRTHCFAIAYPNGDFDRKTKDFTSKAGYDIGFTIKPGFVTERTDPYEIPRLSTNDTLYHDEFILRITGVWFFMKMIVKVFKNS